VATHLLMRHRWQMLDSDPKNQIVINPCFRRSIDFVDPLGGVDAQALVDDFSAAMATWTGTAVEQETKLYNLEGAAPHYPLATKKINAGTFWNVSGPPQLATCLSFYGTNNRPRTRGRLYLQSNLARESANGPRVSAACITQVEALAPIFSGLGGSNVDWIVWSRVAQSAAKVTNFWVDNSFDVVRSRKIPGNVRVLRTTSG